MEQKSNIKKIPNKKNPNTTGFKCQAPFIFTAFQSSIFTISIFFNKIFFKTGNYSNIVNRTGIIVFQYPLLNIHSQIQSNAPQRTEPAQVSGNFALSNKTLN